MNITRLVLSAPGYDPAKRSATLANARSEFSVADGYVIEQLDQFIKVTWEGHSIGFPLSSVAYVEFAQPLPAIESIKPIEVPTKQKGAKK